MKKSTVIIPNYNGMEYIESCMTALERETSAEYEVILVDNGSVDGSREWIETNCPEAKLLSLGENTGFCGAVNAGIQVAETPYVILLNNDTEVEPGFVKALEESLEAHKDSFSVSAKMVDMKERKLLDGAGDLYCALGWAFALGKGKTAEDHYTKEAEIFSACGGAAIYRREVLEAIGGFDSAHFAYLEDCDLGYRAQLYGYRNYYTPKAVVYHAGSAVSGSRYNEFKVKLASRNSIYLIYKNMPFLQILLNLPLLLAGFLVKILFFTKKGLGMTYLKGLWSGLLLSTAGEGRRKKQKFTLKRLPVYVRIQGKLWINTIRRFCG